MRNLSAALGALALLAVSSAVPGQVGPVLERQPATLEVPRTAADVIRRPRPAPDLAGLAERYRRFLEDVDVLIADEERAAFLALSEDYRRDAYIREFWQVRDPTPRTARNERQEEFSAWAEEARRLFGALVDLRARTLLVLGPPTERFEINCGGVLWPTEVWVYKGHPRFRDIFPVFFLRRFGVGHWQLWDGALGRQAFFRDDSLGGSTVGCNFEFFNEALAVRSNLGLSYAVLLGEIEHPPKPKQTEWVETFASYSTDLPAAAETFPAELALRFPGWQGRRTLVEGELTVAAAAVGLAELGGYRSWNFVLNGEVLIGEELFERFRYRFDLPEGESPPAELPLLFQRYLRPGAYTLVLRLEDLASGRFARLERPLSVPEPRALPALAPPHSTLATAPERAAAERLLTGGEVSLAILRPFGGLLTGLVRFDTLSTGAGIAKVVFSLEGTPILTKSEPPYSVELDLGRLPQVRTLRATAYAKDGAELASDELLINGGGHRFRVRLTDPVAGAKATASVRARATVEVPEGERLDRLEFYVNETLQATLYGPPWVQPLGLPDGSEPSYVRAVAYLANDAGTTEDLAWINAPAGFGETVEVNFVEVYASVIDGERRPVTDLAEHEFRIEEDGVAQPLARFELLQDLPCHIAFLLDLSASMDRHLEAAVHAVLDFGRELTHPRDRMALLAFNDRSNLLFPFTHDLAAVGGALAGLKAERGTALYDSLIESLFFFNGISGQRALILLSDGEDESSRYRFEDALESARKSGVTIYAVGLGLEERGQAARKLERLATETGGQALFLRSAEDLAAAYRGILRELRSRYLLAYEPAAREQGRGEFREIEVAVARRGLKVRAMHGYYP